MMKSVAYKRVKIAGETTDSDGRMQAVTYSSYGALDALRLEEIAIPTISDTQVRVRVHAAAVHVGDCFSVAGAPFVMRFATGLLRPKYGVPGFDLAGTIEAVGKHVKRFKIGDEVFGASVGTCADYARAEEKHLVLKPAKLSFEQAAALPTSGLAALHAIRDVAKLQPGAKVLINGASGGVGHFAVQIARSYGAQVTGVCSTRNIQMLRSIGAHHVVDYTEQDFTKTKSRYDLVFDNVENRSLKECRRVLTPDGMLILNSGTGASGLAMLVRLLKPLAVSPFVRHKLRRYLSVPNHEDLCVLTGLVETGQLMPVVDKTYSLPDTPAALHHIDTGHARGKVVVRVRGPC